MLKGITPISDLPSHAGDTRDFVGTLLHVHRLFFLSLLLLTNTTMFPDTIGLLVEKSDAYTVHLPNKPAPTLTRHIVLRDLRCCLFLRSWFTVEVLLTINSSHCARFAGICSYSEMKVSLWGEGAAAFNTDAVNNGAEDKPIVVLFVGGLMKSYQGTCSSSLFLYTSCVLLFLFVCAFCMLSGSTDGS